MKRDFGIFCNLHKQMNQINEKEYNKFVLKNDFSKESVVSFAKKHEIKISVIVGRLMHDKIIHFSDSNLLTLRDKYKWE